MFKDINQKANLKKISPFAEKDEQIITSGMFESKGSLFASALSMGLSNRYHIIAVTDKRILVLPLSKTTTMPIKEEVFSVGFDEVQGDKNALYIHSPKDGKQLTFAYKFGMSSLSGMSKEEFLAEIDKRKK